MDITRGSLDDISRPASSERSRTGSRVSSVSICDVVWTTCPSTSPRSLIVLSSDSPDLPETDISDTEENHCSPDESADKDLFNVFEHDKENEELELQKAFDKMKKLDRILASKIHTEKDVKRKSKELHQKLWQELQLIKPERSSECSNEAENTRLFLSLVPSDVQGVPEDFVPVFGTQVPDQEYEGDYSHPEEEGEGEKPSGGTAGSAERSQESQQTEPPELPDSSQSGAAKVGKKQDFVKRNIQLAGETGGQVPMTQEEKERLAELLRDLEKEEEVEGEERAGAAQGQRHDWVLSTPSGEGFTPEPSELSQLVHIDSRLQLLLPVSDFLSVRSPYPDPIGAQVGQCVWEPDPRGDPQPGDKVLQDVKERRDQERRLQEITQQLEILGQDQDMMSETPALIEEPELRVLLEECELIQSQVCIGGQGSGLLSPPGDWCSDADSGTLPCAAPHLSESLLTELLRDAYTTSFSHLEGQGTGPGPGASSPTEPREGALHLESLETGEGEESGCVKLPLTTNTD